MKDSFRVVTLGYDSIESPISGGEQRSYWINQIYRSHETDWNLEQRYFHDGRFMAYFRPRKRGLRAWVSPLEAMVRRVSPAFSRELGCRPKTAAALRKRLECYRTYVRDADLVQFEHPFAFPFFDDQLKGKAVVYSSHNVESDSLFDYFERVQPNESERDVLRQRMNRIEDALVRRSDLVIACTEFDAKCYSEKGARNVVVAGNGANRIVASENRGKADVPFSRYALLVSSAWKPNSEGLLQYCSNLKLPTGSGLVCAGSIDRSRRPGFRKLFENPFVFFTGPVDQGRLSALVAGARVMALPMLDSGGSNIKTPEALLSDKPIVATRGAFRGYESFVECRGVQICESVGEFEGGLSARLRDEEVTYVRPEVEVLRWPNGSAPAVDAISELTSRIR